MEATWKNLGLAAAIAAVATVTIFFAVRSTAISDFNYWTYDFAINHAGNSGTADNIVLVDFDEETFARIRKFPIPRASFAEVVAKIGAQRPRVIGMDVFLSEPRSPQEDKAMQDALTSAGVVILASQDSIGILPPVAPLPKFCEPEEPKAASGFCVEGKPGALGYGFINLTIDPDGFIRQGELFSLSKPSAPSFPLMLAQQYTGKSIEAADRRHATFNGHDVYYSAAGVANFFLIGAWSAQPVRRVPAWKVLAGEVPANAFRDKLVLIGQTSDAARDRHFTPIFRHSDRDGARLRMGGTEVHAGVIRSLIEGKVVRPARPVVIWTSVFCFCFVAALSLLVVGLGPDFALVAAAMVVACLVSLWL
jgi:adenylate cyclase